jgi:hypothetical protein
MRRATVVLPGCGLLLALLALPVQAATEQTVSFDVDRLTVRNVIGEIRVEDGRGSGFEVVVTTGGRDSREGAIRLEKQDDMLEIGFPQDQSEFVYPPLGDGSTSLGSRDGNWLSGLIGSGKVRVRGSGAGMELWADVVVRVPRGATLQVEHAVGRIAAEGVDANLELATRSGDVALYDTRGELQVATGSGDIEAVRVSGTEVSIATGSGNVVGSFDAEEVQIATGSGDVELATVAGLRAQLATGSGDVTVASAELDHLEIGTGSGEVTVALDRISDGEYNVGTGSGDIVVTLPSGASVDIHAETDGGDITVDLADASFQKRDDDEVRLTVGDGAASVRLGSGNGSIRLRH